MADEEKEQEIPEETPTEKEEETEETPEKETPTNKRINQIYGRMKAAERELASFKAMTKNSANSYKAEVEELRNSLATLQEQMTDDSIPDPIEDSLGNQEYWKSKLKKQADKHREDQKTLKAEILEDTVRTIHDDYDEVIARANLLMQTDLVFKQKIDLSSNPYKTAYAHVKALDSKENKEQTTLAENESQAGMETGNSYSKQSKKFGLTQQEKKTADSFGISYKDYEKHIQKMQKEGRLRYER